MQDFRDLRVYFNKDSSRLNSVAERLGLLNRNGNLYKLETMGKIDWFEVDRRREEFKFIFGKRYIILSYQYLISCLYKTLLDYKKLIYNLDEDDITLLATKSAVMHL